MRMQALAGLVLYMPVELVASPHSCNAAAALPAHVHTADHIQLHWSDELHAIRFVAVVKGERQAGIIGGAAVHSTRLLSSRYSSIESVVEA
jgi:hypothetical protein